MPDEWACVELNPTKGYCTKTLSPTEQIVDNEHPLNGKTWWDMRPTFVMLPPESYAHLKAYLIKNCKNNNKCAPDLATWERKMRSIDDKIAEKGQP